MSDSFIDQFAPPEGHQPRNEKEFVDLFAPPEGPEEHGLLEQGMTGLQQFGKQVSGEFFPNMAAETVEDLTMPESQYQQKLEDRDWIDYLTSSPVAQLIKEYHRKGELGGSAVLPEESPQDVVDQFSAPEVQADISREWEQNAEDMPVAAGVGKGLGVAAEYGPLGFGVATAAKRGALKGAGLVKGGVDTFKKNVPEAVVKYGSKVPGLKKSVQTYSKISPTGFILKAGEKYGKHQGAIMGRLAPSDVSVPAMMEYIKEVESERKSKNIQKIMSRMREKEQ